MKKTNIARLAVTAGLTLAMGAGMVAPATVAMAADYGTGSITINKVENSDYTQSFVGYQIFKAKVTDNAADTVTGKKETDIDWANGKIKAAVEGVAGKTFDTPQDAADWIVANVHDTKSTTQVEGTSVAHQLAEALKGTSDGTKLTAGTAETLTEGYWVFMMDTTSTLAKDESGTAPIFAVVGGSPVNVTEKVSTSTIPTPDKKSVRTSSDDKTDTDKGGSVAVGDTVTYELSATIPSNIKDYKSYKLIFSDKLSDGLTFTENSVKNAKIVNSNGETKVDLSSHLPVVTTDTDDSQTHVFTYDDIISYLSGYTYAAGDKLVFQYDVTVNNDAATGKDLNNKVTLTYSNDPNSDGTGTSENTPQVHEYTYKLVLNKVDLGTEKALGGAVFTVKNADNKYINENGGKSDTAVNLTATDGALTISGLDAGTYTVHEVSAPKTYDTAADFTFTIAPTFDNNGIITGLGNTVSRQGDVIAGTVDGNAGDNVLNAAANSSSDQKGTVTVTVGDKKEITMPLTGMKGTTALMVYGSAILVISAAAYLKHKRNAENDDAE